MVNNPEIEVLNRYVARVHYKTVCYTDYYVYAATEEEAKCKAENLFKKRNELFEAQGGDPKVLESVEIKNEHRR